MKKGKKHSKEKAEFEAAYAAINSVIDDQMEKMRKDAEYLPELYRDVVLMGFGYECDPAIEVKAIMSIREVTQELKNIDFDLREDVTKDVQEEGVKMVAGVRSLLDKFPGSLPGLYDRESIKAYCSWRAIDTVVAKDKSDEQIREELERRFEDSVFVQLPTLTDLYRYEGDSKIYDDETPLTAWYKRDLRENARRAAVILDKMGKILLPDLRGGTSTLTGRFEYFYLDETLAGKILIENSKRAVG